MRVVLASKAQLVPGYATKPEALSRVPDLELTLVVPEVWPESGRVLRADEADTPYRRAVSGIWLAGNFHLYVLSDLGAVLDRVRPDLLHMDEEPYNLATAVAVWQARRRGIRILVFAWQNLPRNYPPPFNWLDSWVLRHIDGALAGTPSAAEVLRGRGYTGPLWVIPQFGVSPALLEAGARRLADGPERSASALTIGFAGRLVEAKGVDLLLDAVAGLAPPWRLVLAGDGPERQALGRRAEALGVADRVVFSGWLPSTEVAAFYASLDLLVLPSRTTSTWAEQFGRVLVEAMACGVPCVGSDSGEIPYVLGEAGMLVPEGDVASLRATMVRLAADPEARQRLAAAGHRRVRRHFTTERIVTETAAAYAEILAPNDPSLGGLSGRFL